MKWNLTNKEELMNCILLYNVKNKTKYSRHQCNRLYYCHYTFYLNLKLNQVDTLKIYL